MTITAIDGDGGFSNYICVQKYGMSNQLSKGRTIGYDREQGVFTVKFTQTSSFRHMEVQGVLFAPKMVTR